MAFYIKEMVSELVHSKKEALNPFLVSKLNIPSMKVFGFPHGVKVS